MSTLRREPEDARAGSLRKPDSLWRYDEWKREFDQLVANGNLPNLSRVRISHDHVGRFAMALGGFDTPETRHADTDLALGLMVEAVAKSNCAKDTLFIITEDDCQDGPDHVDSHRATTYVVGPYVKERVVVSTPYSQDQTGIDAKLSDGVLRLELPKVEKARPRQITVRTD